MVTTAERTGRTVSLQAARAQQESKELKERYDRVRAAVERVISHLVRHGSRHGRYFGQAKTFFQALWSAAAVNLQRLMGLLSERDGVQALRMAA